MNINQLAAVIASAGGGGVAELSDPVLVGSNYINATGLTVTTAASFTPTANSLLIAVVRHRNSNQRTHLTPTTDITGASAFVEIANCAVDTGTIALRTTIWLSQQGGSPTEGDVTATLGNTASQLTLEVFEVTGHKAADPHVDGQEAEVSETSGGPDYDFVFPNPPAAGNLVLCAASKTRSSGTPVDQETPNNNGYNQLTETATGLLWGQTSFLNGGAAQTINHDVPSGFATASVAVEIARAS